MFVGASDPMSELEIIDSILKLGLGNYFEMEIKEALDAIGSAENSNSSIEEDLYATSLCFRLLRQYGHNASQDMFIDFMDESDKLMPASDSNVKGLLELFEASYLGSEGENLLKEARLFSMERLRGVHANSDHRLAKEILHASSIPLHWTVEWYNTKKHIYDYENNHKKSILVELAKLNFNIVQSAHQQDLKELSRWWFGLGISQKLSFSRDRVVESFLYATGIAPEPEHGSLRKWLSKVIKLILIIDDVYDVYGSLDELERFSNAVDRWKPEEVNELPECMKVCLWALFSTTEEMAVEIHKEKGWTSVLPYLQKSWADFCKSLLLEAKWHSNGYTPSLEEYLDNGWISSSGPLLSLLVILGLADRTTKNLSEFLADCRDIIYHSSLIIRLCNDQGTSTAELERGDAASSIMCYMREANVSEEAAREHIGSIIMRAWRKINSRCIKTTFQREPDKHIINTARAAHFIYQHGDGFGVQDRETREQVLSYFIEPLPLSTDEEVFLRLW